jgi:hypothetical protein
MKFFTLIVLFVSTSAFAFNACQFQDTMAFGESKKIELSRTDKYNTIEIQMIVATLKLDYWREVKDATSALAEFNESTESGEIIYYSIDGKKIAMVHYYPGENEYGAFFEMNPQGKFKLLAKISDGDIDCSKIK